MAARRDREGSSGGFMLELLTAMFVAAVCVQLWRVHIGGGFYSCPSCGSRNGVHSDGCQWKR